MKLTRNAQGEVCNEGPQGAYIHEHDKDLFTIDGEMTIEELRELVAFIETFQPSPVATRAETEAAPKLVAEVRGQPLIMEAITALSANNQSWQYRCEHAFAILMRAL